MIYSVYRLIYLRSGWVLGDLRSNDFFLRELAVNQRVASVNVEYR